jgi:trk system potassium uptake protein TrkH
MFIPVVISLVNDSSETIALLNSFLITLIFGGCLSLFTKKHKKEELRHREAFIVVSLSWIMVALFGSLPYLFTGSFSSFTDAYFESMSGFTTTGASALVDIESLSAGILFWRSMTQWIGGMGIILFALAILPMLGAGGMQLFKAEVPEISVDKLKPRIIDTAKALWFIYVGLTAVLTALYMAGGMDLYDAVNHSFTTMATGGFSTKNASMAHYKSPFIEYTASVFMFLAGVNYSLHFHALRGNIKKLWRNNEFRFYLGLTLTTALMLAVSLIISGYNSSEEAFRHSLFQIISMMTTTGYSTADFEKWPSFTQIILIIVMFAGGMIGSTGGGIKQVRILLTLKHGYREMFQLIHPHAFTALKLDEKFLTKELLGSIWGFVFLFLFVCLVATVGMTAIGLDILTASTTVISAMCNVGPALGDAGPAENYSSIPDAGKWILIFCMLVGRLEVYTVLILFMPGFWKK